MGVVQIPPNPAGGGNLKVTLDLNPDELRTTLDLLKRVVHNYGLRVQGSSTGTAAQASVPLPAPGAPRPGPSLPTAAPAMATQPVVRPPAPMPVPAPASAPATRPVAPAPAPAPAPRPIVPAPQPMLAPTPTPVRPSPMPQPVPAPVPTPVPQPQPRPLQQQPPPQPAGLARQVAPHQQQTPAPAPAAASTAPTSRWELRYTSDKGDHNSEPVLALQYCPHFDGLPGGDGHGGWLVSSSKRLLNLWECSQGGGPGTVPIMVLHSQETDYITSHMAVEPSLSVMYGASLDVRNGSEAATVHSVSAESGMLAVKYKYEMPAIARPGAAAGGRGAAPPPPVRMLTKVLSLHNLGGGLRNCFAAAHGPKIMVFESVGLALSATGGAAASRPKAEWIAHDAGVSAMHGGNCGPLIATGGKDGTICIWDMRSRPPNARHRMKGHAAHVSGVQLINDQLLASASYDGKVCLWDLRKPTAAMKTAVPDPSGAQVLTIKASPIGHCLAASTPKGLYAVDLIDFTLAVSPIHTGAPLPRPYLDVEWNTVTCDLYACSGMGTVAVYKQCG